MNEYIPFSRNDMFHLISELNEINSGPLDAEVAADRLRAYFVRKFNPPAHLVSGRVSTRQFYDFIDAVSAALRASTQYARETRDERMLTALQSLLPTVQAFSYYLDQMPTRPDDPCWKKPVSNCYFGLPLPPQNAPTSARVQ
jgi:hypothetical protein